MALENPCQKSQSSFLWVLSRSWRGPDPIIVDPEELRRVAWWVV
jgi:hypothetical protein